MRSVLQKFNSFFMSNCKLIFLFALFITFGSAGFSQTLPVAADNTVTTDEDNDYVFLVSDFNYSDPDPDPLDRIRISNINNGGGTLFLDTDGDNNIDGGETVNNNQEIPAGEITDLKFRPAADDNGAAYADFDFEVHDGSDGWSVASYNMDIDVDAVNDEPSFTNGGDQFVPEDSPAQTVGGWALPISPGAPDEVGQTLTFHVTNNNSALFSVQPDVDEASGNLTYTPAPDAFGTATVTIYLQDNGGGDNTSPVETFDITITGINDPPTGTDNTLNCYENGILAFANVHFGYSDTEGDPFTQVKLTTVPGAGTIWIDSNGDGTADEGALANGAFVPIADINAGRLKYMPLADENGSPYTNFGFEVYDGTDYDPIPNTMILNVLAVNSEPSFTAGPDQNNNEDDGPINVAGWAISVSPGAPDEAGQTLTFHLSNDNNGLFSVQPAVNASGDLSYTLALDASGVANVDIYLTDDGGTANGGQNTSLTQSFVITVTAVNDPPVGADNSVNCFENSTLTWVTGHFNYSDIEMDPFTQVEITTTTGTGSLWLDTNGDGIINGGETTIASGNVVNVADINAGLFKFAPLADDNGSPYTTYTFRVHDGTDYSVLPAYTMTINVLNVNSEPDFIAGLDQVINEDAGAQTIAGWASNITAGAPDEEPPVQTLTFHLSSDNPGLFAVAPAVDPATGTLTYTPAANAHGTANVDIYLKDDGGTAYFGDDTSPTYSFQIIINSENDVPILVNNNPLNINEGDINQIINSALLQVTDVDNPAADIEYTLTSVPSEGTLYLGAVSLGLNDTFTQADINANYLHYDHAGGETTPDQFNFTVADGDGGTIPANTFTININPVNDDPEFTSSPITTANESVPYTYNITTNDSDGPFPPTISGVVIPGWAAFTDNGDGTATLSGTPPLGAPLNNPVQLTVSDGIAPAVAQNFNIQITSSVTADAGVNDTTCTADSYTLDGNQPPAGYMGTWTVIDGAGTFADNTLYNTEVTNMNSGVAPNNSNTYRWTIRNSDGSHTVYDDVVIVNNTVEASVTDVFNVCGTSVTIQADNALNPGESGLWSVEGSPSPMPVIVSPNNRTTDVTGLNNNVNQFRWTVTKETCSDYDIMQVDVIEVYATAGGPAEICSEPFTIKGNDPALLGGTGQWTVAQGSGIFANAADPTTTVTNSSQNVENQYVWTVTVNGCSDQASVFVENNIPTTAVITTPNPSTSCNGSFTISAQPADPTDPNEAGYWTSTVPGVVIASPNNPTTDVSNLQEGANLFTWHISNGTCPESTADITVNNYVLSTVNAGNDDVICSDTYNLAATPLDPGENGLWTFTTGGVGSTIIDPTNNTSQVIDLQRGLNILQWEVTQGSCSQTDLVQITNMSVNANISTGSPQVACADPSQMVTANNPNSQDIANPATAAIGSWSVLSGGSTVDNPNNHQTTFSNLDEGSNKYIWTITNGFCSDTDTIEVINNIPTQADAGRDTILCSTTLPNLNGNDYDPLREIGFWRRIAGGATITTPSLANTSVTNLDYYCTPYTPDWWNNQSALNVFEWVIQRDICESTDQVSVLNGLPEYINAGVDQTVCDNVVNLDALDEASCADEHWWEQIPDVGGFEDPFTGALILDADRNMPFNVHVNNVQDGMTQFIWHLQNNFLDSQGNPIVCHLTDTVEVTSLGLEEDVNAGQNQAFCDDETLLNATDPNSVWPSSGYDVIGEWAVVFGSGDFDDYTSNSTLVSNIGYDTNIYRWTINNVTEGCIMTDDVYIHNGLPSAAQAGPNREVCDTYTIISANNPARSDAQWWTVYAGGGTIIGSSCANYFCTAQIDNMSSGVNTFVWHVREDYFGPIDPYHAGNPLECELTDTITITNNIVTASAGADIYMCADTAQLLATPEAGSTGYWLTSTGTFASTGGATSTVYNDVIRGLTTGQNTLTWTVEKGSCSDSDNIVVWNNLPPTPYANNDQTVCNSSAQLSASPSNLPLNQPSIHSYYYGKWTAQGTATIQTPTAYNTWVHDIPEQSGTYFIWHTYNDFDDGIKPQTCELTDTMYIFNNSVTAEAGSDLLTQCGVWGVGADFQLNANPSYNGIWVGSPAPGATITNPTLHNTTVTGATDGDHVYRWTVSYTTDGVTCSDDDYVNVPVRIPTTSNVNPNIAEICIDEVDLQANNPFSGVGTWTEVTTGGATILDPTANVTQAVNVSRNGNSVFRWTIDRDGCTSTDEIEVTNNTILADADDRIDEDAILGTVSYNDSAICGNVYILSATDPNNFNSGSAPYPSGEWTVSPGTVTFDNPTLYNTTVRNLNALGDNTSELTWTITKGSCVESSRLDIINNEFTIDADVNTNPNELETCNGTITLAGEQPGSGTGYWDVHSGGGNIQNPTLYNTLITNVSKPSSVFRWTVTRNGCTTFDDVTVYNNSVTANAGVGFDVCGNTATLPGTPPAAGETGTWTPVLGGSTVTNPTLYNSGVTNLAQGQNRFRWRITKGKCSADDYVEIINNEPDDFMVEADKESCAPDNTISVSPAPEYSSGEYGEWSILAGGALTAITDITAINTDVTDLQPGFNKFQWTVTKGACPKYGTIVITNNQVIADAGLPQSVCNNTTQLEAANPETNYTQQGTGTWSVITGTSTVDNPTAYNSWVTDLDQGQNTFRWTLNEGGCSDDDEVSIFNNSVTASASNQVVCSNTATFDGNMPAYADWGEWTVVGSSGSPNITTPSLNTSTVSDLGSGINTFRWKVWNAQGCADSLDITINNQEFTTSAGPNRTLCSTTHKLEGKDHGPGYSGYWEIVAGGAVFSNSTQHDADITGLAKGDNIFRWNVTSDAYACTASDEVTIINSLPNTAIITTPAVGNRAVCGNTSPIEGSPPGLAEVGTWSADYGVVTFDNETYYQTNVNNLVLGDNEITWTITKGSCSSDESIIITNNEVVATAGVDKSTLCSDVVKLSGNNPAQGSGLWTDQDASSASITDNTLYNTTVTNIERGTTSFRWTVSLGTCSAFDEVVITNNQIIADAGNDESTCNNYYDPLDGNDVSGDGTGVWSSTNPAISFVNPTDFDARVEGLEIGDNTLRWTVTSDAEGCIDFDEVTITNNTVSANAGFDIETCNSDINLSAVDPTSGSGVWTKTAGGSVVIDNSTDNETLVSGLTGGIYTFRWTVTEGSCSIFDEVTVTNSSPSASVPSAASPEVCDGNGSLQANPLLSGETGLWIVNSGPAVLATPSSNLTNVSDMKLGDNVFTWRLTKGSTKTCISENSVTITNNEVVANAGGDKTTVCNDYTTLSGNNLATTQGSGLWTDETGTTANITDNTLYNTEVTNIERGTTRFRWTVSQGTCSAFDEVLITNNQIIADAGNDESTCTNYYEPLDGNDVSGDGTGIWTTTGTAKFTVPSLYNTRVEVLQQGINELKWTVTSNIEDCTDSDIVIITNNSVTADAGTDRETCNSSLNLSAVAPNPGTGVWTQTGGASVTIVNSTDRQSLVTGLTGGTFTFKWIVTEGACSADDEVVITNSSPSVSNPTTPSSEVCDGNGILQANPPGANETGLWTGGGSSVIANNGTLNNTTVSNMPFGENTFTWTLTKGTDVTCTSSNSVSITNNDVTAGVGPDKTTSCLDYTNLPGNKITLEQVTGLWTDQDGSVSNIVNPTLHNSLVTNIPLGTTTFRWTVTKGSCNDFAEVDITNNSPSVAVITSPAPGSMVCSDATTLQANNPAVGSGVWSEISGITFGTRSNYQTTVSGMTPGPNTFTWTISNEECSSQAQITIINDMVTADAGTSPREVCTNFTTLNAVDPIDVFPNQGTGHWTNVGAGSAVVVNSLLNTSQVTGLKSGSNMFRWTVENNSCSAYDEVEIINRSVKARANDVVACYGEKTNLDAASPAPGQSGYWTSYTSGIGYIPANTLYNAEVTGLVPGNNTFVWNLSNGLCSDSISITVTSVKPVADAGSEQNLCESYTYLSANEPVSGQGVWSLVTGAGVFADPSLSGTYVSEIGQGENVYQWTVTDRGCTDADKVEINNNLPIVSAGPDQPTCVDNVVLAGNEPAAGETGLWTQQNGITAVITDPTLYNTTVTDLGNGVSTFKWTVTNSDCSNSDMVAITYNKLSPDAGDDKSTCNGVANLIAADPSPATGEWMTFGAGTFENPTLYATTVNGLADGPNTLRWTVKYRGCEAFDEIVIDNNEVFVSAGAVNDVVCTNAATLTANEPAAPATGLWTKSGGSGVFVDDTNHITDVNGLSSGSNVFTWTITDGSCSKSDDIIIYNRQITNINAGVDRNVCDTEIQLAALAPPAGTTGKWSVAAGGGVFADETLYNTAVSDLIIGENQLRWTLSNGDCTASDIVTITNQMPTPASVSSNEEICTSTFTLVANAPGAGESGLWTKQYGAQGNILTPTDNVSTVTNVGSGTNTFRWTISNAICSSQDEIVVTNSSISTDAGIDLPICTDTAVLAGDNPAPGTGVWSVVNSGGLPVIDNPSQYSTVVRSLGSGSNTFKWTVSNGRCEAWDVVSIVNNTPTKANAGDKQTVCDGTVVLSGNNPTVGTGLWTRQGGSGDIQTPSNYNTLVTKLGTGGNTFRWTVEQESCVSYDDVTITNDLVYASAGMNDEICTDSYPELNGNMPAAEESGEWTVSGGTGVFADPTLHNTAVSGLSQGENRFTWTVRTGDCQTASDVIITNNTPSTATVSSNQDRCVNFATISGNPPTTGTGSWSLVAGNGVFDNTADNTTVVRDVGPGVNQYMWTIQKGDCSSDAVITITNNSVEAVVGDSIEVCGTQAYLNGNEPDAGETGTWTNIAGTGTVTNPTLYNSEVTGLNKGNNKFRWSVSNGDCDNYADIIVTNNLYDANASVAGPTTICSDQADLLGNIPVAGAIGTWTVEAGAGAFDDPNNPSTTVRGLLKGDNTIRWSVDKDGCINYDEVVITNNMVEALAGDDVITCGDPVSLVANNLFDGQVGGWTVINGSGDIQDPSDNQTLVTNLGSGTNVFRWTVSGNGCTAYDQVVVSENSFTTSAGLNKPVCSPSTTLNGADPSPGTGIWSISGSPGVSFANPTSNVTMVYGLQDNSKNTFRWTVTKNGCTASDEVIITNDLIKAVAGGDQPVCQPTAIMSAQNPAPGTGQWTITSGGGTVLDPTSNISQVEGLALGNNTLVWTVQHNSCPSQDVVVVTNNMVTATAGSNQVICSSESYLSGDQPQDGGYGIWEVVGGPCKVETPSLFNSYVSNLQQGLNSLRWTVYQNGCNNGGDLVTITNNSFNAYAGEDQLLPPLVTGTSFGASLPAGATGSWSILSGNANIADPVTPDSDVTDMTTGENTFRWMVQHNDCEDYDDVIITVRNFEPFAGNDQSVCSDSAKLNARDEGSSQQYWSKIYGAGDFDDPTDPKTWVRNIAPGENIYRWTVTLNGYTDYDEVTITNNYFEISAGTDAESCENYHTMNADMPGDGGTGFWTVVGATSGGVFEDNTLWNTRVSNMNPGKNRFRWEVQWRNCTDADTVEITWNRPPVAEFTANPAAFCAPEEVVFTNTSYDYPEQTPADTFFWYTANDMFATTSTTAESVSRTFDNVTAYDSTHVIRLVALNTETGCIDTFTSSVDVYARPDIGFEARPIINYYPDATINILNYPSAQPIQNYLWFFGNDAVRETILQEQFVNNFSYEFSTWGDYIITLTGTTPNGCEYTVSDSVFILPPCPQSNADNSNAKGCEDLTVNFVAGVAYGETYHWDFGDGNESTEENPSHTFTEPGTYFVRLKSSGYGCDDVLIRIDTIQVYEEPVADFRVEPREIMVPNQPVHFYNFSENAVRYEWNFGDTVSFDREPLHYYSEPGVYDVSLQVWSENECYASKTIERAVYATEPGMIRFPDAFTPDPSGSTGGAYPCGDQFRNQDKDNDIFHPVYNGVTDYKLEIYNRWGEKIFESNDVCVGWDGYINGVLAPQDVYVFKATGRYKNGGVFKETGSVTLLR